MPVVKSITTQSFNDNAGLGSICKLDIFEGICNSLVIPDSNVYGRAYLLKSDVLDQNLQILQVTVNTVHFFLWNT